MSDLNDVVILSAVRTAVGRFGGSLSKVPMETLGALCVKEAAGRAGVKVEDIQSAIVGNVIRTKSKDAYISRMIAIEAGMSIESHAVTVNRLCGSGLEAIVNATQQIQTGEVKLAVAGGAEVMSQATFSSASPRDGQRMGSLAFEDDLLATLSDPFGAGHMGMTAEKVGRQFEISREDQDAFAAESHRRAAHAVENGYFKEQIVPVEVKSRKQTLVFDTDEHFRADVTAEGLSSLPPAFQKDGGTVTAGNASGINDGASMLVLADAAYAAEQGLKPLARIVAYARAGVEPSIMGTGPIPAVRQVMEKSGLSIDDMDVIESNEAFAAQACAVSKELGFPADKTNPNGGAVALGHPVGATGAIISTKALYELARIDGRYALITLCIGGGQGIAAIYERL